VRYLTILGRESLVYPLPISDRIETDEEIDSEEDGNGERLMMPISAVTFEGNHEGAQLCLRGGGTYASFTHKLVESLEDPMNHLPWLYLKALKHILFLSLTD
jgi:hypothetical protein